MLTGAGRERHEKLHRVHVTREEVEGLLPAYHAFLSPNQAFKELTTRWQTSGATDPSGTLESLKDIHALVTEVLVLASVAIPRFKKYEPRFGHALAEFDGGNAEALAKPRSDSFHDVWMELHEDLLLTLGRERSGQDG